MADNNKNKAFTTQKDLAFEKLKKYCAYRDRCHSEVRNKLLKLQIFGDDLEEIISDLILDGYLSEERFARSYVRGKFRMNHWGKNKIITGLKAKSIPSGLIHSALGEIEEDEYKSTLFNILAKKHQSISGKNAFEMKQKLIKFALGKGYEYPIISEIIENIDIKDQK